MIKKYYDKYREIISYLFWGGINFTLSMFLFWMLADRLGFEQVIANTINWIICVIFAFITNKIFVFKHKTDSFKVFAKEFFGFITARIFTLIIGDLIIWFGCDHLGYGKGLAQMIVKLTEQFVVIVLNYILSKMFVFKKSE